MRRRAFLRGALGAGAWLAGVSPRVRAAERFTFWNALFDASFYQRGFLPWWEEALAELLRFDLGVDFGVDYGAFSYPDLEQRFLIAAGSGRPDLIEGVLSQVPTYQAASLLEPLSEHFGRWSEADQFHASALAAVSFDGALWGLPYVGNARALVYRRSLLAKHGLAVPASWDELIRSARIISGAEPDTAGFMMTTKSGLVRGFQEFMSYLFQLEGRLFEPRGGGWTLRPAPEALARVLELYRALFEGTPSAIPRLYRGQEALAMDEDYSLGRIAMMPNGPFIFARRTQSELQRRILEEDTGVAPLPLPPGGRAGTYLEVKTVMVNAHSRFSELAWEVAKLWCGREAMLRHVRISGDLPVRADVSAALATALDGPSRAWQARWAPILPTGRALDPVPHGRVRQAIDDAIQEAVFTTTPIEPLAEALHARLSELARAFP